MTSPWWTPDRHADRRPFLLARTRIKSAIRTWFEAQGFAEVDPACLQASPGNETHLNAFKTDLIGTDLSRRELYLHTSPEFAMKKLLAAGETKIFAFTPCFRNRERGPLHSPEFTMLEWYRADEPYFELFQDCQQILRLAAHVTQSNSWHWKDIACPIDRPVETITVDDAFSRFAGVPLFAGAYSGGRPDRNAFAHLAEARGVGIAADDTWLDIFSRIITLLVEPRLGHAHAQILSEYPSCVSALAQPRSSDPRVAERFELFCCGVELANGFGELTDARAQRANLEFQMMERQRIYGERYPLDEDFLAAVDRMPPASGCALGFDRLVMLASGASHIEQVQWTPLA